MNVLITLDEIKELLQGLASPTSIAVLSGSREQSIVEKWLQKRTIPSNDEAVRIAFALKLLRELSVAENPEVARAWFFSANVHSDDEMITPVMAIRNDDFNGVRISASRLINDVWD